MESCSSSRRYWPRSTCISRNCNCFIFPSICVIDRIRKNKYPRIKTPNRPIAPIAEGVVILKINKRSPADTRPKEINNLFNIIYIIQSVEVRVTNLYDLVATTAADYIRARAPIINLPLVTIWPLPCGSILWMSPYKFFVAPSILLIIDVNKDCC